MNSSSSAYTAVTNKIFSVEEMILQAKKWRSENEEVVFTNGCFDILHKGHVTYLAKARDKGTRLIIGLNTDHSVQRLEKGNNRPVNKEDSRALVLASLQFVDGIVLFDNDTPVELITSLQPDVLVKGADYDPNETNANNEKYIVGSDIVKNYGGRVEVIDLVAGFSTTSAIKRMTDGEG